MIKFVLLAIVLTSAQSACMPGRAPVDTGTTITPAPPGCVRVEVADGKSALLCNGTAGVPGPVGPPTPRCEQPKCCRNPLPGPTGAAGPVGVSGPSIATPVHIGTPSFVSNMFYDLLMLPVRLVEGIIYTAYEVVVRALAYFIQGLLNVAAMALVAYTAKWFYGKTKEQPPLVGSMQGFRLS